MQMDMVKAAELLFVDVHKCPSVDISLVLLM